MNSPDQKAVYRRARLRQWIDERFHGVQADFVRATGINQGELSLLLKDKSFGEKRAASIEKKAGMPPGYLEGGVFTPSPELLSRAHLALVARGSYNLADLNDARAFSDAYVAAAAEQLNAFQRMESGLSYDEMVQEELRKKVEQAPGQDAATSGAVGKVSTR
ncbi:hypothetical protein NG829_08375 [Xanthomonas sacchari]|uniref:XRE family transcriptional regulator n=1 Tax=Xanthomonas sacchari TaxID=56458 RepID=A0ABT3DTQ7_9XANT|nr:hypothetical protein [Xanthomonas sacchari]MCW0398751.1 hypothetical protein [Xanthomonas sacchari]MCW0418399.1 hypothetical protein [Xanthomonas sacchari]UYK72539.1 hypothetical protein NG828_20520 [Xanthomonas sacchari]UYK82291.1 hypothetical protein NG829_08375 [Xanthomonas sacchari]